MVVKFLIVELVRIICPKPIVSSFDLPDRLWEADICLREIWESDASDFSWSPVTGHSLVCTVVPGRIAPIWEWSTDRRTLTPSAIRSEAGASLVWRLYEDRVHEDT